MNRPDIRTPRPRNRRREEALTVPAVANGWPMVTLSKVITDTRNGLYKPDSFYGRGTRILKMFNIGRLDGTWKLDSVDRLELNAEEARLYTLLPGDLLVNRVNSRELVGKCAVVDDQTAGAVFESKNVRVRFDANLVLPEWAAWWLNSHGGRTQIDSKQK